MDFLSIRIILIVDFCEPSFSNELVKCIEDLCQKRDEVSKEIKVDEAEKDKLEHDIAILHERLQKVNSQLAKKIQVREEYGKLHTMESV